MIEPKIDSQNNTKADEIVYLVRGLTTPIFIATSLVIIMVLLLTDKHSDKMDFISNLLFVDSALLTPSDYHKNKKDDKQEKTTKMD